MTYGEIMDYEWTVKDIEVGREIVFNRDERLMLGYRVGDSHGWYVLIHLNDGAVQRPLNQAQLLEKLNSGNYLPRYVSLDEAATILEKKTDELRRSKISSVDAGNG